MVYALAIGCFVLGLVTRDIIHSIWLSGRREKVNRSRKRGGAHVPPKPNRITVHPASEADLDVDAQGQPAAAATAAAQSRAERLFGPGRA